MTNYATRFEPDEPRSIRDKISEVYTKLVYCLCALAMLYGGCYFIIDRYYDYLLCRYGVPVTATIIQIGNESIKYDICYKGDYYVSSIKRKKNRYKYAVEGQKYYALLLPDKLQHYHDSTLFPACFRMIDCPLPQKEQNYSGELNRIILMYHSK